MTTPMPMPTQDTNTSNTVDNDDGEQQEQQQARPHLHAATQSPCIDLVICGIGKMTNIRTLLQSAASFDCRTIYVVGQKRSLILKQDEAASQQRDKPLRCNVPAPVQARLDAGHLTIRRFDKWKDCVEHLRQRKIRLIGIEIDAQSQCLDDGYFVRNPLRGDIALMPGNEGSGIHPKQLVDCDATCRIPQYGVGTASFNVTVATTMVLSSYHYEKRRLLVRGDS